VSGNAVCNAKQTRLRYSAAGRIKSISERSVDNAIVQKDRSRQARIAGCKPKAWGKQPGIARIRRVDDHDPTPIGIDGNRDRTRTAAGLTASSSTQSPR
jgi:hypothetical protein